MKSHNTQCTPITCKTGLILNQGRIWTWSISQIPLITRDFISFSQYFDVKLSRPLGQNSYPEVQRYFKPFERPRQVLLYVSVCLCVFVNGVSGNVMTLSGEQEILNMSLMHHMSKKGEIYHTSSRVYMSALSRSASSWVDTNKMSTSSLHVKEQHLRLSK